MSLNRAVQDLKVKQLKVKQRSGSGWRSSGPTFDSSKNYRFEILFGNTGGKIQWPDDKYDKENIRITLLPIGAFSGGQFAHSNDVRFYTSGSYSTLQDGNGKQGRAEFQGPFKTIHADIVLYCFFKVKNALNGVPIQTYQWNAVINAAVRNSVARKIFCSP